MPSVFGDFAWLESVKRYVQETAAQSLDLQNFNMEVAEVKTILEFLADSGIIELNLSKNNFQNQILSLSELLSKSKLSKLNLSFCELNENDALSLFKILKDSQITDLNVSKNKFSLPNHKSYHMFSSYLKQSHLTVLNLCKSFDFFDSEDMDYFIDAVCKSSITHLNVDFLATDGRFCYEMIALFHNLKDSLITHLSAASNFFNDCDLTQIGDSLRKSKLVELNLSYCSFNDRQIDTLFEALVGTRVTTLKLAGCCFSGSNNLFHYLKQTQIEILDLSDNNGTCDEKMFDFPNFLSGTSVVSLDLSQMNLTDKLGKQIMRYLFYSKLQALCIGGNYFEYPTLYEFARVVPQTAIVHVSLSSFYSLDHDQLVVPSLSLIGEMLVSSGIRDLDITNFQVRNDFPERSQTSFWGKQPLVFSKFLDCVKKSCVTSLTLGICQLDEKTASIAFPNLMKSKVTYLDLSYNAIGRGLQRFAAILKFTVITNLNLKENYIKDEDVKEFAKCLKGTRIIDLNLSRNDITECGAKFLAFSLRGTDILTLKLKRNQIDDQGMKFLAENAAKTLITTLKVSYNPGNRRSVESVIWNNRRLVRQFVRLFKQIAPENGSNAFKFEEYVSTKDNSTFLKECLNFYDIVTKVSSASLILSREDSFSQPREQIRALLTEEFPRQFVEFVVTKIIASKQEHIIFLKKVEEMGLTRIVELLLSNRPIYCINQSLGILHPYVYPLLNKYKLPICNPDNEHQIRRIVEYFTECFYIEGARDVINMLKSKYTL